MHLFEFTTQMNGDHAGSYCLPMQTIYAIKESNGGKLDSHFWFFNAFAEQLRPTYTFLIDVGTKPEPYSIVRLFACMERNKQIGGCCGEIAVAEPNYLSLVQATQHYEYKTSNIMGKCLESLFGYIAVLPGAFSAYRYEAIRGQPLQR
jgi:chitin synthase